MVCVVSRVLILTLSSKHLVCFSRVLFDEYDYVVTVEIKNKIHWGVLLLLSLFIFRFSSIDKTEYNHVYVFTNPFGAIVSLLLDHI